MIMETGKVNFDTLPHQMRDLPVFRGYPVPWFVAWVDGPEGVQPEFRAMDGDKLVKAVRQRLCWVCGQKLGVHMAFVAGPMCGVNRTSAEPPSHYECAKWSAENCPFLVNPRMVRREDDFVNNESFRQSAAGHAIVRNPGVAMLWMTRTYEVVRDEKGRPLFDMGHPERVEFYREARLATKDEVLESVNTGIHNLYRLAEQEKGGLAMLEKMVKVYLDLVEKNYGG